MGVGRRVFADIGGSLVIIFDICEGVTEGEPPRAEGMKPNTLCHRQVCSYAFRKSFRRILACVQIVLKVEPLIRVWLGIVSEVRAPSVFSRTIAICSRSRTRQNPRSSNALTTLLLGVSTGNLGIRWLLPLRPQKLQAQATRSQEPPCQKSRYGSEWQT